MNALEKLKNRNKKHLHICVGLDTDINKIPKHLLQTDDPIFEFNKAIINETREFAAAYKFNLAFYEAGGTKTIRSLEKSIAEIPSDILTIGDAKRGDIGNTSAMYAKSLFEHFGFDASTLNPLMGYDSLEPFFNYQNKLHFVLGLTSNPGSADFEQLKLSNGNFLYEEIITKVKSWGKNIGIVFGATNEEQLEKSIDLLRGLPLLIPGVGSQGGSLENIVQILFENNLNDFLINISRSLIYLDKSENFAYFTKIQLTKLNEIIRNLTDKNEKTN